MQDRHITIDALLLHAAGMPPLDGSTGIDDHLRVCMSCSAFVEHARHIGTAVREQQSLIVEPPLPVASMARGLFAQVRPDLAGAAPSARTLQERSETAHAAPLEGLRRVLGNLAFDSLGSSAFAGLRATGAGPRHLAFQSELGDLDLQITSPLRPDAEDARWRMMGQLELRTPASERVEIEFLLADRDVTDRFAVATAADEARGVTAMVDDSGYFSVELPAGTWAATTVMGEAVLVFPEFTF